MDSSVLTQVLNNIQQLCGSNGAIFGYAKSMLFPLMTIDFALAAIMNVFNIGGSGYLSLAFSKILKYGFWIWVVTEWDMLINVILDSLTTAGASFGNLDAGIVGRPSDIITYGFKYAGQYYDIINTTPFAIGSLGKSVFLWIIALIAMIGIFAAFAYIALNAFITFIEFYIVSALMLLFIPFAALDKTARFAENAFGFIIGTGVKLMMMGAILSLAINESAVLGTKIEQSAGGIGWEQAFSAVVLAWVFAFLSVHVPELASGAMSGSPSMTGNMATASMAGATSGGIAGHMAGKVAGATSKGSNAVAAAAGAFGEGSGGKIGGALKSAGGAIKSLSQGDFKGAGAAFKAAGSNAAQGIGGGLKSMAKAGANKATSGLQDAYDQGQGASQAKFGQYHPRSNGLGSKAEEGRYGAGAKATSPGSGASGDASSYDF